MLARTVNYRIICQKLLTLLLLLPINSLVAQVDFEKLEITTTEIAPGLFLLTSGYGGNVGLSIGDDGVFLIDDELTPMTPNWLKP